VSDPADRLRRHMVDELTASGNLPQEWRNAFLTVPRHSFIPDIVWRQDEQVESYHDLVPLRRSDDEDAWLSLAYARDAVLTQIDDGHPTGVGMTGRQPTSSASGPDIVAFMLAALNAQPGMTVCEIGTGTGYHAALLAARLGARNITTIEIDPQLAEQARHALVDTGYGDVTVVTGDGADGYPPRAPYDRTIATCAVREVPYPWITQTRPGGQVLTPWGTAYLNSGLLSLTVGENGAAQGGIVGDVAFMWIRDQRVPPRTSVRECVYDQDNAVVNETDIHPYQVAGDRDASFAIGLRVPSCKNIYAPAHDGSGEYTVWFLDQVSRSWASIDYAPGADTYQVRQRGPRHLWDEVAAAYHCWTDAGSPKAEQWRFTVTSQGQHVEFVC